MFVLGNLIGAIATVLDVLLNALSIILIVNALLSWVRPDPSNPIVRFLDQVSDAVCEPVRRLIPTVIGGLDLAPMIVLLLVMFLRQFLVSTLHELAFRVG
ncbi:MAG: YggT family protein [Candidatus Eisenbacteria bacterium]